MPTSTKTTAAKTPPPAAVAADPHWQNTLDRLRARELPTATLTICDDPDARQALASARAAHQSAKAARDTLADHHDADAQALAAARLVRAETDLAAAQEAFDTAAIRLRFQALPRKALEKLIADHPPTEEEEKDGSEWHAETFNPALIAATSVEGITEEDARYFLDAWSLEDSRALVSAALNVQQTSRTDLGKG